MFCRSRQTGQACREAKEVTAMKEGLAGVEVSPAWHLPQQNRISEQSTNRGRNDSPRESLAIRRIVGPLDSHGSMPLG